MRLVHLTDDLRLACPRCEWTSEFGVDISECDGEILALAGLHDMVAHDGETTT